MKRLKEYKKNLRNWKRYLNILDNSSTLECGCLVLCGESEECEYDVWSTQ